MNMNHCIMRYVLCEDKLGNLWVGLKDGMLRMYDADKAYKGYLTESGIVSTTGTPMLELFILLFRIRKESSGLQQKGDGLVRAEPTSSNGMSYKLTRYLHREEDM